MPNKVKKRDIEVEEMDLKPFMNLMVVLIPLLLASAQFAKIATVDITLPKGRGTNTAKEQTKKPKQELDDKMILMTLVTDTNLTLMTKDAGILTVFFQEVHDYVLADDPMVQADNKLYNPHVMYKDTADEEGNKFKTYDWSKAYPEDLMNFDGVQYNMHEREEIRLWAYEVDKNNAKQGNKLWKGVYRTTHDDITGGDMIEYVARPYQNGDEKAFFPVQMDEIKAGEQFVVFTTRMSGAQRRDAIFTDSTTGESDTTVAMLPLLVTPNMIADGEFATEEVSAYDVLKHCFLEIRRMNPEAKDRDDLIIASENQVFYDKVVQVMDVAKNSGLVNLSLNGLRSN